MDLSNLLVSLFSSFDVVLYKFQIPLFVVFSSLVGSFFYKMSSFGVLINKIFSNLGKFLNSLGTNIFMESLFILTFSAFLCLLFFNLVSIFPYIFPWTSQSSNIFNPCFCIWLGLMMHSLFYNLKGFISHSIPEGCPIYLSWFLFLIEVVSVSIRPLTLGIRLLANILAGHLLMILLASLVSNFVLFYFVYFMLNIVEMFVSMIQAYIFITMTTLYFSEAK